ncbi:unnamed protein product, partial [Adineta steineri]
RISNTDREIDTTHGPGLTVPMTTATDHLTSPLLAALMSSSFSRSTLTSNTNDVTSDPNRTGSIANNLMMSSTASITLPHENIDLAHNSIISSTSNLPLLLSTLISHSKITTSPMTAESLKPDATFVTLSPILTSITTSATNINTISSMLSTQQTSGLPVTVFTSVHSETLSSTIRSFSSDPNNTPQNTMDTTSISKAYTSQASSTSIMSSLFPTQTASTILSSMNTISGTSSLSSSPSTVNMILTTLPTTSTSSSVITQITSYLSTTQSILESTASTGIVSSLSSAQIRNNTSLLSLLLTTSGSFISNQTSSMGNNNSSISATAQLNLEITNITAVSDCVFPFLYLGQWYSKCISDVFNDSWCSLTNNFDQDRKWKYCRASRVKTTGGTGNGNDCVFPFIYQGTSFSTCIYRTVTVGTMTSFSLFCSTTPNLDQHGLWGYCLDYGSCYFPFTYNGTTYSDCLSGSQSARWCSTTSNYDRNKMWSNCPVTCDGYPQQDENSVGFRLLTEERPCVFKPLISQDNGLILKYYTIPTCQLEPLCRDNYVPLFKQITCQEDGRYSYPRTICLPKS